MRRPLIAVAALALALPLLAACGSSGGNIPADSTTTTAGAAASSVPSPTAAPANCPALAGVPAFKGTWGTGPTIPAGKGKPPVTLKTVDCLVGKGTPVTDTSVTYNWNYTGVNYADGKVFDSSFTRGTPTPFALNQVIAGWTKGLIGMKPGGRRLLVIPPADAYGATGQAPSIGPNETLTFVVDLVGPAAS